MREEEAGTSERDDDEKGEKEDEDRIVVRRC
jgi:hypothetical protein